MSFWGKTKGTAKFVFVKIPAGVLGINTLRQNNETIRALYESLRNPVCPMCSGGVLSLQAGQGTDQHPNPSMQYTWACNRCDFMILGGHDKRSILPMLTALRQRQSLTQFDGISDDDRAELVKTHALHSRIFLGATILFFLGFCWMLIQGHGFLLSINWLALAFVMFVFFLKKSYRSWQVQNGVLFVPGAFKSWFNNEKWFR